MILYLANPTGEAARAAMADGLLGAIMSPQQGNRLPPAALFCIDNNCGPDKNGQPGAAYPGDEAYLTFLLQLLDAEAPEPCGDPWARRCLFATAPDVLGDAAATLRRSEHMLGWIRYAGLPAAFVAQNGQEHLPVPWDDFEVLFLGGSPECVPCGYVRPPADRDTNRCPSCQRRLTEWKLGAAARALTAEAHRRWKRVHMGRVNSLKRLRYAASIGCETADGTILTRAPDRRLPEILGWQRTVNRDAQTVLWELAS